MIQLIYRSRSVSDDGTSNFFVEIARILETSIAHNVTRQITGVLAYSDGHFLQVLEGPIDNVDTLFDWIKRDPRHTDIHELARRPITARVFDAWSMAYVASGQGTGSIVRLLIDNANPSPDAYRAALDLIVEHID